MGILEGKRILITGVLTDASLAFAVAQRAIDEGADIILTGAGRGLSLTKRTARKFSIEPDVLEMDVTDDAHLAAVADQLGERWGKVDGILHAIGFAPESCLGGGFLDAPWEDVGMAFRINAFSLKSLAVAMRPLMQAAGGGSIVALDFDNTVAWPAYDWMGVCKSALESVARYLARDLGPDNIRVNLVAAGPIRSMAARSIPGFSKFEDVWAERAPMGWNINDADPVGRACVALLSDFFPMTTGEMVHVDGGYHAVGA
jgi:meromycolic acid enoyl-[acyl-carrier-protein] reductase